MMKESIMKSQVREGESFNKRGGMDRDGRGGGRRLRGKEMWADVKVPRSGISEEFSLAVFSEDNKDSEQIS